MRKLLLISAFILSSAPVKATQVWASPAWDDGI